MTESVLMDDVDYFGTDPCRVSRRWASAWRSTTSGPATPRSATSRRFPVDAVKVDRAFVDGLGTDPHDSALVAAIVAMAGALSLEVTAEGVETQDQLTILKRLDCQRAQGFYLARPMPAAAMTQLVAEGGHWQVD